MLHDSTTQMLAAALRESVAAARPGERLPSTRELTSRHRVSPVTVSRALAQLVAEGLVTTRPGAGTYVAASSAPAPSADYDYSWQTIALGADVVDDAGMQLLTEMPGAGVVSLVSGYPHPSLTAARQLSSAMIRVSRRPGLWERPPVTGVLALRRWFAEGLGPLFNVDDVLITSGGQAAISSTLRALVPAGGPVLMESPTYLGALAAARAAGVRPVPIPVDSHGLRIDLVADAFAMTGARVLYCQPTFHNPTGAVMSDERRLQLLQVAKAAGAFIIEDDWARYLAHDATAATPPLIGNDVDGRVVHIKSLTKTVAPSMRVGALVARGPVAERLRALRLVDDMFVTRPLQEAAVELVTSPAWVRHLAALSLSLRQRRDRMLTAVTEHAPGLQLQCLPRGGFYLWMRLPPGLADVTVAQAARRAGVLVSVGRPFFAAEAPGQFLRLSFGGTAHSAEMLEGVRRLASVVQGRNGSAQDASSHRSGAG